MDAFERKKLKDIKQVMSEFVSIQLAFHSKALEFYSQCHHSLSAVREDDDLEEFRNSIRPLTNQMRQYLQQQMNLPSGSAEKKPSTAPLSSHFVVSTTGGKQKAKPDPANRNGTLNSSTPSSMYSQSSAQDDDDDDDDDADDSEEEDEDDDDDDDDTEQVSQQVVQKQTVQGKLQITPRRR